jgi:predicted nucleic acid-binding protein
VSAVTAAEVLAASGEDNRDVTVKVLDSFGTVPVDMEVAQIAGLFLSSDSAGELGLCDCLVAAGCSRLGAVLLTRDRSRYPASGLEITLAEY